MYTIVLSTGAPSWAVLVALARPKYAPEPTMVIVFAVSSTDQVAAFAPLWGATGAPHPSASTPACQASSHVCSPRTFLNEPSALKTYSSSNKQARPVTSSQLLAHQVAPAPSPTANAPALGRINQVVASSGEVTTVGGLPFLVNL